MSENTNDVKSTSVAITLNAKNLGVDAFIKLEQVSEFVTPISEVEALVKREEMAQLLTEQLLAIVADTSAKVKAHIIEKGITPVVSVNTGASNIKAVANGAETGGEWKVAVDAFDSAKQVRYLSMASLPTDSLKQLAANWISGNGINADAFDVWDERRDAEAGKPISSICNIKLKEDFRGQAPTELIYTDKGGVKALARAKFNSDGSVYFYWANKEVQAAVKYGALNFLKD
jgi:hypothetical protein